MLIKCPDCGKEISSYALHCIHCGFPLNECEMLDESVFDSCSDSESERPMTSYEQWVEDIKRYNPWTWTDIIANGYPGKDK